MKQTRRDDGPVVVFGRFLESVVTSLGQRPSTRPAPATSLFSSGYTLTSGTTVGDTSPTAILTTTRWLWHVLRKGHDLLFDGLGLGMRSVIVTVGVIGLGLSQLLSKCQEILLHHLDFGTRILAWPDL